ncbi:unnamed protein product [Mytilus edulis]|uniref:Tyr recombinase domain-containing protein n=1 Tax=Mytilus edulis TaxID=6550 RepID=A0A8S3S0X9_MYTED|nr:unnamed protein product [Mytilus edulis]
MVVYLDDGMGIAENFETCSKISKIVEKDLLLSGFIANTEKSVWEPVQVIEWLGFVWNFKDCTLEISTKKLRTLKEAISNLVEDQWKQFETYTNDSRFASVIRDLPSFVESARSSATIKKYKCYFKKFEKWCNTCSLECLPATITTVSLYLGGLIQQGSSVAILDSSFYAIKWFHDFHFKHNPCSDKFLGLIYEGGRRLLSKPIIKKEPITPDILNRIVLKFGDSSDLKKLRVVVLFLLGFSGFLRYSELANIKMSNIEFYDSYIKICIEKSKTDLYRRGNSVIIAATAAPYLNMLYVTMVTANPKIDTAQPIYDMYVMALSCTSSSSYDGTGSLDNMKK